MMKRMSDGRASGPDGIVNELITKAGPSMRHAAVALFRTVWEEMTVPEEWLLAHIVPIYKKAGARSDMRNYRPIALMSIMAKTYEAVLNVRLTSHLEKDNRIGDEQAGVASTMSLCCRRSSPTDVRRLCLLIFVSSTSPRHTT